MFFGWYNFLLWVWLQSRPWRSPILWVKIVFPINAHCVAYLWVAIDVVVIWVFRVSATKI
uniref:Uncharacterized protein n=1 Tax=Octopus bimaculoides TaxID=37653 RepID=A0A0L8GAD3_OCTBM